MTDDTGARAASGVRSIERAFELLEHLADAGGRLALTELAEISDGTHQCRCATLSAKEGEYLPLSHDVRRPQQCITIHSAGVCHISRIRALLPHEPGLCPEADGA